MDPVSANSMRLRPGFRKTAAIDPRVSRKALLVLVKMPLKRVAPSSAETSGPVNVTVAPSWGHVR